MYIELCLSVRSLTSNSGPSLAKDVQDGLTESVKCSLSGRLRKKNKRERENIYILHASTFKSIPRVCQGHQGQRIG